MDDIEVNIIGGVIKLKRIITIAIDLEYNTGTIHNIIIINVY